MFVQANQRLEGKTRPLIRTCLPWMAFPRSGKQGGVFKDTAFSQAYLEKDFQNAITPIVELLPSFSNRAIQFSNIVSK